MKKILFYLLAIVAIGGLTSCSSDDEPTKLELLRGQSSTLSIPANHIEAQIDFYAPGPWSATVSSTSRAWDDVDWLTINSTHGQVGEATIPINLQQNKTGKSRTAYIIITCLDQQLAVEVTQTATDDPNWTDDETDFSSMISQNLMGIFSLARMIDFDGNLYTYNSTGLVTQISGNMGKCVFTYSNKAHDEYQVIAEDTRGWRWGIKFDEGTMLATHIDAYYNNELNNSYDLEYNNGYLTKFTQYKEGKVYETSQLKWENGDVSQVVTTFNGGKVVSDYSYSTIGNLCGLMMFDTQLWIDMDEMQCFYYCGFFGKGTNNLIKSSKSVEYEDGRTYNFSSTYSYEGDGNGCITKCVMSEIEEGEGGSSTVIDFSWEMK